MKFSSTTLVLFACALLVQDVIIGISAVKILSVSFFARKSHKLTYMPLLEELGKRGHNITILTPIKPSKQLKNVNEILMLDWEEIEEKFIKEHNFDIFEMKKSGKKMNPFMMADVYGELCKRSYELPIIQTILKEDFDLLFFQPMFNDCVLGLLYRLKAPIVIFTPKGVTAYVEKVGGHLPPSFNPNLQLGYPEEMNFYQRFVNFGYYVFFEGVTRFYYEPRMEAIYRDKLGQDIPSVSQILSNQTALILSNGHFSLHRPKPLFPDIIDVGGIHSQPAKPLPKDLEDFIQKGKDGFIYFSMGSAIKDSQMPEEKRKMFINVFSKLKQQVLWKWDSEIMPDLPKNVKLSKWLPQQDLLGHKDIKMFITHCGGGSTEEAIYHGVPLLGLPMFSDQPLNAKLAKNHGLIVILDWNTVTEVELLAGIQEILKNPEYSNKAKRLSAIFTDQPDDPLMRAVFWVEYVIRHKGAHHLRSVGRKLNFLQYHSYDVILAYLGLIGFILYLIYISLRLITYKLCFSSSKKTTKTKRE